MLITYEYITMSCPTYLQGDKDESHQETEEPVYRGHEAARQVTDVCCEHFTCWVQLEVRYQIYTTVI